MNIFGSILSEEVMTKRTSGGEGCDSPGDYLRFVCILIYNTTIFLSKLNLAGTKWLGILQEKLALV